MRRLVAAVAALTLCGAAQAQVLGIGTAPQGTIEYLTEDGDMKESWTPFALDDYAFDTRAHFAPGYRNTIGIAASQRHSDQVDVVFDTRTLDTSTP